MRSFLLFLVFFLPFQFALNPAPGIDLSLARLLVILAFFVWLVTSLVRKKLIVKNNYITWGLVTFLALAFLSIIKTEEPAWALRKFLVFLSIFPLYFFSRCFSTYFTVSIYSEKTMTLRLGSLALSFNSRTSVSFSSRDFSLGSLSTSFKSSSSFSIS